VTGQCGCPATSNPIVVYPVTPDTHTQNGYSNGLNNGTITVTPLQEIAITYTAMVKWHDTYTTQATSQFTI
jgi:hypothetical protein